jgi:hypothetical protein
MKMGNQNIQKAEAVKCDTFICKPKTYNLSLTSGGGQLTTSDAVWFCSFILDPTLARILVVRTLLILCNKHLYVPHYSHSLYVHFQQTHCLVVCVAWLCRL